MTENDITLTTTTVDNDPAVTDDATVTDDSTATEDERLKAQIERPTKYGYAKVARAMATDEQFAIFRRFSHLARQDLLYRQAELVYMESDYIKCVEADAKSGDNDAGFFPSDWFFISDKKTSQWSKWLQIREKLDAYYDCLSRQMVIAKSSNPYPYDLECFRKWLRYPNQGAYPLHGRDESTWRKLKFSDDLVSLLPPSSSDRFTRVLLQNFYPTIRSGVIRLWRHIRMSEEQEDSTLESQQNGDGTSKDPESGMHKYHIKTINSIIDIIVTVLASMFPVISIIVLWYVQSMNVRIGVMSAFTTTFAIAMATFTRCTRQEVFSACAAYAAVQVVFLQITAHG